MNDLIKFITCFWLAIAAFVAWIGFAFVGFFFAFTSYAWITRLTPICGITIVICIIRYMVLVMRSNPTAFFMSIFNWLETKLGKAL